MLFSELFPGHIFPVVMAACDSTEVQSFYQDCGVFITGGTGTLGKLTIEKILRSCPGVKKVYVLIRPKKKLSVEDRKKSLLDNVVFDRMKSEQPGSVEKIVFVPGDCSSPRLGLSDSDYHDLTQHVNIVLHLAATVRFDEDLKTAINVNVMGTQEVIKLCQDTATLKAVVFVSTAFSNPAHKVIKEEFYEPPFAAEELFYLLNVLSASEIEVLCPKIIGSWPNTYAFSKAMSENMVLRHSNDFPAAVVRPSMVISTLREPFPGWLDNIYGPMSLVAGFGTGILHVCLSDLRKVLDVVPADIVANCVVAAALSPSKRWINDGIQVYNVATSSSNSITIEEFQSTLYASFKEKPLKKCIWYPFVFFVTNHKIYMVLAFFLHYLPGLMLDLVLSLTKHPSIFLKIYRKVTKFALLTSYFSLREFTIITENTQTFFSSFDIKDKKIFLFDTKAIEWSTFLPYVCDESRKYMLDGFLISTDDGRSHFLRLYIIHTIMKTFCYGLALWLAWSIFKPYMSTVL